MSQLIRTMAVEMPVENGAEVVLESYSDRVEQCGISQS